MVSCQYPLTSGGRGNNALRSWQDFLCKEFVACYLNKNEIEEAANSAGAALPSPPSKVPPATSGRSLKEKVLQNLQYSQRRLELGPLDTEW